MLYVCSPGKPTGPRADARRMARALRALGPLWLRHRVRRMLFGDLRDERAAARRARGRAATGSGRLPRTSWSSPACRSARTRRGCARALWPAMRQLLQAVSAVSHLSWMRDEPRRCSTPASRRGTTKRMSRESRAVSRRSSTALVPMLRAGDATRRGRRPASISGPACRAATMRRSRGSCLRRRT